MCNCGKKRSGYTQQTSSVPVNHSNNSMQDFIEKIFFQYTGNTALTVIGNITGRRYRFAKTGDVQPIDFRDVQGLKNIAALRKEVNEMDIIY